ncbi:MAG TPA: hypothetical protein VMF06_01350 [Candidatus Limnocylindria bacterium]|nr:hypothetical protein [Candidatus Limnocylindria bacterium]
MMTTIKRPIKNALILIADIDAGEIPSDMGDKVVASNRYCIAVGTLPDVDGETEISISDINNPPESAPLKAFQGILKTRSCHVAVKSVLLENILLIPVSREENELEIWTNDKFEPSKIVIIIK